MEALLAATRQFEDSVAQRDVVAMEGGGAQASCGGVFGLGGERKGPGPSTVAKEPVAATADAVIGVDGRPVLLQAESASGGSADVGERAKAGDVDGNEALCEGDCGGLGGCSPSAVNIEAKPDESCSDSDDGGGGGDWSTADCAVAMRELGRMQECLHRIHRRLAGSCPAAAQVVAAADGHNPPPPLAADGPGALLSRSQPAEPPRSPANKAMAAAVARTAGQVERGLRRLRTKAQALCAPLPLPLATPDGGGNCCSIHSQASCEEPVQAVSLRGAVPQPSEPPSETSPAVPLARAYRSLLQRPDGPGARGYRPVGRETGCDDGAFGGEAASTETLDGGTTVQGAGVRGCVPAAAGWAATASGSGGSTLAGNDEPHGAWITAAGLHVATTPLQAQQDRTSTSPESADIAISVARFVATEQRVEK